jgi:hypothetical protein
MEDLASVLSSLGAGKANAEPSDVTFETTHNAQREGEFNTFIVVGAAKIDTFGAGQGRGRAGTNAGERWLHMSFCVHVPASPAIVDRFSPI